MEIYLVGGAVRDELLERQVRERDWVVIGGSIEEMLALGYRQKDVAFPVFVHPESGEEYALARRERKRGHGHKGFDLEHGPDISLHDDLARRDLTINAMARDRSGQLIDPFGGATDLERRLLRHVTPAFVEDPLRVLRLARFLAELEEFGFRIHPDTAELATRMSAGNELGELTPGRIWRETWRALHAARPQSYFRALQRFGALPKVLGWLTSGHDPEGDEAIEALERVSAGCARPSVRLATLATAARRLDAAAGLPAPRWPLPGEAQALATLCMQHRPPSLDDAESVTDWLQQVDGWRRARRFEDALTVWRAVSPREAERLEILRRARDSSRRVPRPPAGRDPRSAVRQSRVTRIRAVLNRRGDCPESP